MILVESNCYLFRSSDTGFRRRTLSGLKEPVAQLGIQEEGGLGGPPALHDKESSDSEGTAQAALPACFNSVLLVRFWPGESTKAFFFWRWLPGSVLAIGLIPCLFT